MMKLADMPTGLVGGDPDTLVFQECGTEKSSPVPDTLNYQDQVYLTAP
jgi:hypothetical protein